MVSSPTMSDRTAAGAAAGARPNVVLILADDMGYSDIGCFGSEISTPNLDALAAGGLRVTQMYNGARCCPTRASLLTGLYAHQAGIGHMVRDLGAPGYQGYLNDRCVTLAEALRPAGYRTFMSGKWHVGGQWSIHPEEWRPGEPGYPHPLQRGFDHYFGTLAGAGSYYNPHTLMRDRDFIAPDPPPGEDAFFYTDAIGANAAAEIDRLSAADGAGGADAAPFFVYAAYTAPHWPLHALPEDVARYRGRYRGGWDALRRERYARLQALGIIQGDWDLSPRDTRAPAWDSLSPERQDWEDARMAVYAAQIECLDRSIGRILDALRRNGRFENTLIMFLSDNGGCAEFLREDGPHASAPPLTRDGRPVHIGNTPGVLPGADDTYLSYDLPWANASNTPFRLYKHWVHEGGISTPFVVHWPGAVPAGGISHTPCHLIDVLPTCLAAAGATHPGGADPALLPPEGESLLPLFAGDLEWQRRRPIFWEHEGNRAVRDGRWKLVSRYPDDWELYDLGRDRTELHDLTAAEPERAATMRAAHDAWAARCAVLPWEEIRPAAPRRG